MFNLRVLFDIHTFEYEWKLTILVSILPNKQGRQSRWIIDGIYVSAWFLYKLQLALDSLVTDSS